MVAKKTKMCPVRRFKPLPFLPVDFTMSIYNFAAPVKRMHALMSIFFLWANPLLVNIHQLLPIS